jgi:hypothetical protein
LHSSAWALPIQADSPPLSDATSHRLRRHRSNVHVVLLCDKVVAGWVHVGLHGNVAEEVMREELMTCSRDLVHGQREMQSSCY